jgi:2-haloacid dehalogenase
VRATPEHPRRPAAVAFDVNETLFGLGPVGERMAARGMPGGSLDLWFARTLRNGFALAASGTYRPFREVAAATLRGLLLDRDDVEEVSDDVLGAFAELEPHPDVASALQRLADAGIPAVTLTVGASAISEGLLERHGLRDLVRECLSSDDVEVWKPLAAPYEHAARTLGVPADRLALVAVHAWDIHGARRAGLVTGWASRLEGTFPEVFDPPDVTGPDLVTVIDGLLALE